ncbi:MAG: protein tyrosine kinase, partial [Rhodospirillales bacterium]|nr:protein tyrosine kinase [Rhodospirillales bacterium]
MSVALPGLVLPAIQPPAAQWLILRRHWRLVLASAIAIPALGAIALAMLPASYNATGIVLYDPAGAAVPGGPSATTQSGLDEDAVTASQGAIIASLPAAAAIAQQLGLANNPAFNPALRHRHFPFTLLPRQTPQTSAALAAEVQNRLSVLVLPGSRVISVSFIAPSAQLAADAANLAMQIYLNHERETSFQALTDAQNWLEAHSAVVQQQLDDTETALAKARAGAGLVQGAQATLTTETASRLAASLVEAQAGLAMAQARLDAAAQAGGDEAAANAAIAPNLLPLRTQQAQLAAQLHSLASEYGADYPPLVTVRAQLGALTAQIAAETNRE